MTRRIALLAGLALFLLSISSLPRVAAPTHAKAPTPETAPARTTTDVYLKNGQIVSNADFAPADDFKTISPLGNGENRLYDYANGYCLDYPADMWVDSSLSAMRVVIANYQTRVEIYHDVFAGTVNNSSGYIDYSNRFLNNPDLHLTMNKYIRVNGLNTHLLLWDRSPLALAANDRCRYLSAEIVKNNHEVYTILVKSSGDPARYLPLVKSFGLLERQGTARINTRYVKTDPESRLNRETRDLYRQFFSSQAGLKWGIYDVSAGSGLDQIKALEKRLGRPFCCLVWYQSLGSSPPRALLDNAYKDKKFLELTMQTSQAGADNRGMMYAILNGRYEDYFTAYARELKNFGHPVLFRLDNEMNGDWCFWCGWYTCKDTDIYKEVWQHIYHIFQAQGVDNVLWVWNPTDISFPSFQWNNCLAYFPGVEYVDIIGLTGYNTGTYFPGEYWRSFDAIYRPLYSNYMNVFDYPFMITEFACNSVGGDKEQWISQMFQSIKNYPNIKVANWFNGIDLDARGKPGRIYRLDEDPRDMAAFARGLRR